MPQLTSVANAKTWLRIPATVTSEDALLGLLLEGAEYQCFRYCGRCFGAQTQWGFTTGAKVEYVDGASNPKMILRYSPITAVSAVAQVTGADSSGVETLESIDLTGLTVDGYPIGGTMNAETGRLGFRNGSGVSFDLGTQWPEFPGAGDAANAFPPGLGNIKVSYTGGYSRIPDDLEQAALELVGVLYKRRRQYPVRPGEGADQRGEAPPSVKMPPHVKELLEPYRFGRRYL